MHLAIIVLSFFGKKCSIYGSIGGICSTIFVRAARCCDDFIADCAETLSSTENRLNITKVAGTQNEEGR